VKISQETETKRFRSLRALALVIALAVIAVAPARANGLVTVITGTDDNSLPSPGNDWNFVTSNIASGGCNLGVTGDCQTVISITPSSPYNALFVLTNQSGLSGLGVQNAVFTLSATSDTVGNCATNCTTDTGLTQGGFSGSFSYTGATGSTYAGQVLLTGTFTAATLTSNIGQATGGLGYTGTIAVNSGNISFSSAIPSVEALFTQPTEEDASWQFTSIIPTFSTSTVQGGGTNDQAFLAVGTVTGFGSGSFAVANSIPEPDSLTLTSLGFGLCGLAFALRGLRSKFAPANR